MKDKDILLFCVFVFRIAFSFGVCEHSRAISVQIHKLLSF